MGIQSSFVLVLVVLIALAGVWSEYAVAAPLHRTSFPQGFLFGSTTSAYQHEGAAHEGGRRPSIWDTFSEEHPENIVDGSNGSVAADQYHRYKEDVAIMKDIGLDAYRFSISWPRLLPRGNLKGGVNQEGIAYYNNLINELIAKGIQPFVTLFHWDVPQALEDQYGGFRSPQIVKDYVDYVDLCYKKFGDRVKMWFTINEPQVFTQLGYDVGILAPGRCSTCYAGDSATEPYIVGHNLLLAHAAAVRLYRQKYQTSQKGQIGIVLATPWIRVTGKKMEDGVALSRAFSFRNDWFLEPLRSGSYPAQMVKLVRERLPRFTSEQSRMLRGSYDFLGINYYTCYYVKPAPCRTSNFSYTTDSCTVTSNANGSTPAGEKKEFCPEGLTEILVYTKKKMNNPVIYITENGASGPNYNNNTLDINDNFRIGYHEKHLEYLLRAIREYGVKVKGYFVWSFMDEFEWVRGYTVSYGIVGVDFENGLRRFAKASAKWFKQILQHS